MQPDHCRTICLILLLSCLSCAGTPKPTEQRPMRHVDVACVDGEMVDVREIVDNLYDEEIYRPAREDLLHSNGALLSSATVRLLESVLADHSWVTAKYQDSEDIRMRAVCLLGLSRNPKAIAVVTDRMFSDPAWRVRGSAACALGRLTGEQGLPALLAALKKNKISKLNSAFHFAGDKTVPLIIRWMEEDFAENGGQNHAHTHVSRLRWIGDRRAIEPLLRIVAHPGSPTDPRIDVVRFDAAEALANFTSEIGYYYDTDKYSKYLAIDPAPRRVNRRVTASDRKRIVKALENAGYNVERLIFPFSLSPPDVRGE